MGGDGDSIHCWGECKLVQPLWKSVWRCLRKLKIELSYEPDILLLHMYLKGSKSHTTETLTLRASHSAIHNSQVMELA
jgi:hypothetical protein